MGKRPCLKQGPGGFDVSIKTAGALLAKAGRSGENAPPRCGERWSLGGRRAGSKNNKDKPSPALCKPGGTGYNES